MLTGMLICGPSSFIGFKAYRPSAVFSYPDISNLFNFTTLGLISLDLVTSCLGRSGEVAPRSKISPGSNLGSILGADSVDDVMEGAGGRPGAGCEGAGGGLSISKMDLGGLDGT